MWYNNSGNTQTIYSSYFKLHMLRLRSFTPVAYCCKLLGVHSLAAFLQLEIHRVNKHHLSVRYCSRLKEQCIDLHHRPQERVNIMIPQISRAPGVVQLVLNFLQELEQQGFTGDTATSYADRLTMSTDNSIYQLLPRCGGISAFNRRCGADRPSCRAGTLFIADLYPPRRRHRH